MASDRAKEVAERQKAEAKALKEAKKNSTNPSDWSTVRQVRETIKMTVQMDPSSKWWMGAALVVPILLGVGIGLIVNHWLYATVMGILIGVSVFLWSLIILSKRAMYKKYDGQPGAAQVALGELNKKTWTVTPQIVGTKQADTIHRAVGPVGIVLVGDGDPSRVKALLATERKRHEQISYDVPVHTISVGNGDGQVPLRKASAAIKKMSGKVSKAQISQLDARIKALDNIRGKVPVPRGPMPNMRGARKAMRGR
ncbi:MAG: DUF4191 domain-containing protein [Propionibacteriaceae bacterium]|nr:DUF4191 domain-containing protein [Propionibacteriaceae bacterium]